METFSIEVETSGGTRHEAVECEFADLPGRVPEIVAIGSKPIKGGRVRDGWGEVVGQITRKGCLEVLPSYALHREISELRREVASMKGREVTRKDAEDLLGYAQFLTEVLRHLAGCEEALGMPNAGKVGKSVEYAERLLHKIRFLPPIFPVWQERNPSEG